MGPSIAIDYDNIVLEDCRPLIVYRDRNIKLTHRSIVIQSTDSRNTGNRISLRHNTIFGMFRGNHNAC